MKDLIIVESPSKAKTIDRFVGGKYMVIASKGHVSDLPKSELGIDIENHFKPKYVISPGKQAVITSIKKAIPTDGNVYIASDPDREGEAIAWHVAQKVGLITPEGKKKTIKGKHVSLKRIVFHEITKDAVMHSFEDARDINMNLVDAQQARRTLDRLVGYKLSPLLWTKIRYGLSAGRVQSVAVRLVVERERERDAFKSTEYWTVDANFLHKNGVIPAGLQKINNIKCEIHNQEESDAIVSKIKDLPFNISNVISKEVKRHPAAPFITSTLQQDANRKLGYSAKQTMMIAQKLYEGVKTNEGNTALITYMRTDSHVLSNQALDAIRGFIKHEYGDQYLPKEPILYKKKSKLAQEAHEAIRPVDVAKTPHMLKDFLSKDEYRLYELIWKRSVACQMVSGVFDALSIDILGISEKTQEQFLFKATGQKIKFDGFLKVYHESFDDEKDEEKFLDKILPPVEKGDSVKIEKIIPEQHFTQPPPRYSEATLIKALEENGIGRPSTYAPIISTIVARGYVEKENKYFKPLDVGYVVNDLLVKHFSNIVDMGFTSQIEKELDEIADGQLKYDTVLSKFYGPFEANLEIKNKEIKKEDVVVLGKSDELCPECGKPMVIKLGKFGRFLSCSNFPDCKGMKSMDSGVGEQTDEKCEKCGSQMVIKMNKKGIKFLGCSKYPECDFTKSISTGLKCEWCGADLVERKSKWGKTFYGCSRYPECKFILKKKPVEEVEKVSEPVMAAS